MKIVIDPGHGGSDVGAEGFGLQEKNINLDIALNIRGKLANYADITMTRTSDVFVSLYDRAAIANKIGADFFISIHVNAGGGTGFESYVYDNASAKNEQIRQAIHKEVANFYQAAGFVDRGMKRANFAVLRETKMPSVLLENLFIDNQTDANKLKDPAFRQGIAGVIANGVIKAFDLHGQPQPLPQPVPPPHWAADAFAHLVKAGLVNSQHDLDSNVTWGEMSAVISSLLDKLKM